MPNDDVGRHAEHTHACAWLPSLSRHRVPPLSSPETVLTTATCPEPNENEGELPSRSTFSLPPLLVVDSFAAETTSR